MAVEETGVRPQTLPVFPVCQASDGEKFVVFPSGSPQAAAGMLQHVGGALTGEPT